MGWNPLDPIEDAISGTTDLVNMATDPVGTISDFANDPIGTMENAYNATTQAYGLSPGAVGGGPAGIAYWTDTINGGTPFDNIKKTGAQLGEKKSGGDGGASAKRTLLEETFNRSRAIADEQLQMSQLQRQISEEQLTHWRNNFQPVEELYAKSAMTGLDPSYYAGRAGADVIHTYGKANDSINRDLRRQGIDPGSGRGLNTTIDMNMARAAAEAGARNQGRQWAVEQTDAKRAQVASMGRQIPQLSLSGLNAAVDTSNTSNSVSQNATNSLIDGLTPKGGGKRFTATPSGTTQLITTGAEIVGKIIFACIPEHSWIDTPEGSRRMEHIRVGDTVIGFDHDPATVLQKHEYLEEDSSPSSRWRVIHYVDGSRTRSCDNHRIDGIPAGEISEGDIIGGKEVASVERSIAGVKRSFDLITTCPTGNGGYRMDGIPVNSMIAELSEFSRKLGEE